MQAAALIEALAEARPFELGYGLRGRDLPRPELAPRDRGIARPTYRHLAVAARCRRLIDDTITAMRTTSRYRDWGCADHSDQPWWTTPRRPDEPPRLALLSYRYRYAVRKEPT